MAKQPNEGEIHVLGIAGSLRKGSYNRALLQAAQELVPTGMQLDIFPNEIMMQFPLYNEDVFEQGEPEPVQQFKEAIQKADALIFSTPEYNFSISGVLKNAIDWASRPPDNSPLNRKPVAIMGASQGSFGTARAQLHLHQICVFTNMLPLNQPQVLVARAQDKFDQEGHLINETSQKFISLLLEQLVEWTRQLS